MATITNKTRLPLNIPLPGGKKLRLGPLKSTEIALKAVAHPSVQKLKEAGKVTISGTEKRTQRTSKGGKGTGPSAGRSHGGGIRKTGNR